MGKETEVSVMEIDDPKSNNSDQIIPKFSTNACYTHLINQKEFIVSEVDDGKLGFVVSDCEIEHKVEDERGVRIVSKVDDGEKELEVDGNWSSFVSNGSCREMVANEPEPTEVVNDCQTEHEDERGILFIVSEVDDEDITDIARGLWEGMKLNLFNFDVIRDTEKGNRYLVIDINYFPGYAKMLSYEMIMTGFFCDLMNKKGSLNEEASIVADKQEQVVLSCDEEVSKWC